LSAQKDREESAIRYLLGGLSESERTSLEEKFFADDKEFEELEIAEGELVDRYVRRELSAADRRQFEQMLRSSPRLVDRVEFAGILARTVPSRVPAQDDLEPAPIPVANIKKNKDEKRSWWNLFGPTATSPAMQLAFMAPLVLLLLVSVALVLVWTRSRTQSERLAAEQQRLQQLETQIAEQKSKNDKLAADLTVSTQQKEEQEKLLADYEQQLEALRRQNSVSMFSFLLNPGSGTRGGGSGEKTVKIPSGTQNVELQLNVEDGNYSLYQASLQNIDHKLIGPQRRVRPVRKGGHRVIPFKVPGRLLPPGSYFVHVDGLSDSGQAEDFNDYPFRVTR